mmetsp:Transcript_30104/g.82704  ORF Transcript_30104/g.82704 Transcript_30104/m.82704 type:complete len:84 (+) Transcript_30104:478-729(+)
MVRRDVVVDDDDNGEEEDDKASSSTRNEDDEEEEESSESNRRSDEVDDLIREAESVSSNGKDVDEERGRNMVLYCLFAGWLVL